MSFLSKRYNFRPRPGTSQTQPQNQGYQGNQGYQPPELSVPSIHPSRLQKLETAVQDSAATLDTLVPMIDRLRAESDFEIGVSNILRLVIAQLREVKVEQMKLQQMTADSFKCYESNLDDLARITVKNEQYSRRDTVTVAGLPLSTDGETEDQLTKNVAEKLSASGVNVLKSDFSAVHRNSTTSRTIRGKTIPPSVTVRFSTVSKKDSVLRGYKNFDLVANKPRDVKVYQSLSPHYSELRISITKFFDPKSEGAGEFGLSRMDKLLKWVTYQSPTSGFVMKLKTGEYFKGIHVWEDFASQFSRTVGQPRH